MNDLINVHINIRKIDRLSTKDLVFVPLWQKDITADFSFDPLLDLRPARVPIEARNDILVHCRNKWENRNHGN